MVKVKFIFIKRKTLYKKFIKILAELNYWRKQKISGSNFLLIAAGIVGILGGIASSLLKKLTHFVASFLQNDVHWEYKYYLYFCFPLIGLLLTVLYIRTFIRRSKFEHGIPAILNDINRRGAKMDFHNIYSQIITSALTVGWGGSAGLEAPAVASGSAIGSNFGKFFGLNYRETTLLLGCGAAAGISGAFGSPVAGMVFAMEVILPEFTIPAVIPLLIAAAFASVVSNFIYDEPLFVLVTEPWLTKAIPYYIILGIMVGFYSIFFSSLNRRLFSRFARIKNRYNRVVVGGVALGILIALFPALYGEGYITIQKLLDGNYSSLLSNSFFSDYSYLGWALFVFGLLTMIAKSYACVITMASGGNGGMFGPIVVVGGLFGFVFAFGLNETGNFDLNVTNFMIAGMAASISGMMHAPLTGIFLAAEITGGYTLMVPLMIVSAIAYFINKAILRFSIYTRVLAEEGSVNADDTKDDNLLKKMKLRYLIEKDFVVLHPNDTPSGRKKDIIQTGRNIFPVVDGNGLLCGLVFTDQLLNVLLNRDNPLPEPTIRELMQPAEKAIQIGAPMKEVIQTMERLGRSILPVVGNNREYLGFVTKAAVFNYYRSIVKRQRDFI